MEFSTLFPTDILHETIDEVLNEYLIEFSNDIRYGIFNEILDQRSLK